MSSKTIFFIREFLNYLNVVTMLAVTGIAVKQKLYQIYPIFTVALWMQFLYSLIFPCILIYALLTGRGHQGYVYYFYASWGMNIPLIVILLLSIREFFLHLYAPFPQLQRHARKAFLWIAFISVLILLSVAPQLSLDSPGLLDALNDLERAFGILQLTLLALLLLCIRRFGLTTRSQIFGFSLGFGVMVASDFILTIVPLPRDTLYSLAYVAGDLMYILASCIWIVYGVREEPPWKPVPLSTLTAIQQLGSIAVKMKYMFRNLRWSARPTP